MEEKNINKELEDIVFTFDKNDDDEKFENEQILDKIKNTESFERDTERFVAAFTR